jgi:hypothetical protein
MFMRIWPTGKVARTGAAALVALAVTGLAAAPSSAVTSSCHSWSGVQPPDPAGTTRSNSLDAVAVVSSCQAWAVGNYFAGHYFPALILQWNGSAWVRFKSPGNDLNGVAATSPGNAWIAGDVFNSVSYSSLLLQWNGTAWTRLPSPDPGGQVNIFQAVAANSSSNAWAVGHYGQDLSQSLTFTARWNGASWSRVASPNPGGRFESNDLDSVAVAPTGATWAVGYYSTSAGQPGMILHWTGTAWKRQASPHLSSIQPLLGVSAASARDAWAVGYYVTHGAAQTLILHWNGASWKRAASPDPGGLSHTNVLVSVSATSAKSAWAVGYFTKAHRNHTLVLHWNGHKWRQVASPSPGISLSAVATAPDGSAWTVGTRKPPGIQPQTLAIRCTLSLCR